MYVEAKSIFSSWTFWLAALQFIGGGIAVLLTQHPDAGYLLMVKSIIDMILRYRTVAPVTII